MSCCRNADLKTKSLHALIREHDGKLQAYTKRYGHIHPPSGVEFDGKTIVLVGGVLYETTRTGPYNIANALHDNLLHVLGDQFLSEENRKEPKNRHPALKWMDAMIAAQDVPGNDKQTGNDAAWFRLAYDAFTIRDNSRLQGELIVRLRSALTFQAARYELKVAAICATAGFDLHYEDESDNTKKHPEFIGVNRFNGAKIAVEAKSRHRSGILGFGGGHETDRCDKLNVRRSVLDAYAKKADLPLYVFVDVNAPPADDTKMSLWDAELRQLMDDLGAEGYDAPCPANAVFFTNDPSHYVGAERIGGPDTSLWARVSHSLNPETAAPRTIADDLLVAHGQRVAYPSKFDV